MLKISYTSNGELYAVDGIRNTFRQFSPEMSKLVPGLVNFSCKRAYLIKAAPIRYKYDWCFRWGCLRLLGKEHHTINNTNRTVMCRFYGINPERGEVFKIDPPLYHAADIIQINGLRNNRPSWLYNTTSWFNNKKFNQDGFNINGDT